MELHLHIGAHRTGTTSMQKLLEGRSASLQAAGVSFWGPKALRGWGLFDLIQGITEARMPKDRIETAQAVLRDWLRASRPATRIVISDENLSGTMLQNHAEAALYPDAEARLQALARLLPAQPDMVCVTIRDPVGYWQSAFAHLASRGKLATFDAERLAASPRNTWLPLLQAARKAFPTAWLRVLCYDDTVASRLLADLVGPTIAAGLPAPRRNFGLALPEDALASLEKLPAGPEREALSLRLRQARDTPDRTFSADQARVLNAAFAADWQALRARTIPDMVLDPAPLVGTPSP